MDKNEIVAIRESEAKAKALADRIVEECRQQGFTVDNFRRLIQWLNTALSSRRDIGHEPF